MKEFVAELPQRKLLDISAYVDQFGNVDLKGLTHSLAAVVIEVDKTKPIQERVLPVILAQVEDGKVVDVRSNRIKDVLEQYSILTEFDQTEYNGGKEIKNTTNEENNTCYLFVSGPGGRYDYETARIQVGRVREFFGVKIIQAFAFPAELSGEECLNLMWRMEEHSTGKAQELNSPEDLRDKI